MNDAFERLCQLHREASPTPWSVDANNKIKIPDEAEVGEAALAANLRFTAYARNLFPMFLELYEACSSVEWGKGREPGLCETTCYHQGNIRGALALIEEALND